MNNRKTEFDWGICQLRQIERSDNGQFTQQEDEIARLIRARGLELLSCNPTDQLIVSGVSDLGSLKRFYRQLGRYSFRLFLRELLEHQNQIIPENLTRYCSLKSACRYLNFLEQLGLLKRAASHYALTAEFVPNFGETLEWYVAEIFRREFGSSAVYRALLGGSKIGGDWDVIAAWSGYLVYLEVKSSPPKAVDAGQIQMFFRRIWELLPDVAIFLEDTQLRMRDKIVLLFQEELARHYGPLGQEDYPVLPLRDEIFHINHAVYITNSKRGLAANLSFCLRDFLRNRQQLFGMP